jgi:hypothetical protein
MIRGIPGDSIEIKRVFGYQTDDTNAKFKEN